METQGQNETIGELVRLSQIEYEQEPGQPDLLGWPVADQDGREFGSLDDMLVDVETGDVPFASICYDDKCTAVPLDVMFLDEPNHRLILPVTKEDMLDAPEFTDDTEDVQPYVEYWNRLADSWQSDFEDNDL